MSLFPPPDAAVVYLTRQGRQQLEQRARLLAVDVIPHLHAQLDIERDDTLRAQLEAAGAELAELTRVLNRAHPADQLPDDPGAVELGEAVTVRIDDGEPQRFVVVDPHEALVGDEHHISSESPLGRELLGRHLGDRFRVHAPGGTFDCTIDAATR